MNGKPCLMKPDILAITTGLFPEVGMKTSEVSLANEILVQLLRRMLRIRMVEESIATRYSEQKMRCPTHLCIGQEAICVGVCSNLRQSDSVVGTHRSHGHYLAKGGDLKAMIAEIYGKVTGCSRGKGGSMHLIDTSVSFMGSTAIVGNTIPIGVGLGFANRLHNTDQVSCIFLGDGAIEEGVFYESVNFAALKKLPVLFVCENNLYSVYSPLRVRQPDGRSIHKMVAAMGLKTDSCDGNDAIAVSQLVGDVLPAIREGNGPVFLEFPTYRWREHCGPSFDNDLGYRTEEEYLQWKELDPIPRLESWLIQANIIDSSHMGQLREEIQLEIDEAFRFAESSPFPSAEDLYDHVYMESL
jgi:TPP-dependent pyruvate/acetoin dehydrogenase alpha subunit